MRHSELLPGPHGRGEPAYCRRAIMRTRDRGDTTFCLEFHLREFSWTDITEGGMRVMDSPLRYLVIAKRYVEFSLLSLGHKIKNAGYSRRNRRVMDKEFCRQGAGVYESAMQAGVDPNVGP